MSSEDVKMEDSGDGVEAERRSELTAVGEQLHATHGKEAHNEDDNADSDDEVIAEMVKTGSGRNGQRGGVTAVASARTPGAGAGTVTDTAGTAASPRSTGGTPGGKSPGGKSPGGKSPVQRLTREDPAAVEKLRAYVASLGGTLPPGWVGLYKMRMSGGRAGQYDLFYRSPEGRVLRYRTDVLRMLGLDPSGGAAAATAACGVTKKVTKGSRKKAVAPQPAEEGAATSAAAVPTTGGLASLGNCGVADDGKWTLPLELPREDAFLAAKKRSAELSLKPPFVTDRGVTVLSLGSFQKTLGFYDATHIWPLGYRAAWIPPHSPAAAATGSTKNNKKEPPPVTSKKEEPESAPGNGEEKHMVMAEISAAVSLDQTPTNELLPPYRFISEIRKESREGGGEGPSFAVLLEANADGPSGPGGDGAGPSTEALLVHVGTSPDSAWSAVVDLQITAVALCKRAKTNGVGPQPSAIQRALAAMPMVNKVWGFDCFGLSDVRVLQVLEALPGVDDCEEYLYVQQRNSWELEAASISAKRNVVLSAAPNRRAAAAATKQRKQQHQLSIETFVDRPPASPKADGLEPAAGERQENLATAVMAGKLVDGPDSTATPSGGKKPGAKSRAEDKSDGGKVDKTTKMARGDMEIRAVVDRLVERVSLLMTEPDEIERQKMIKAMEKADRELARRRARTAEKAAEKAAAVAGRASASDAAPDGSLGKNDKEKVKDQEKKPKAPRAKSTKDKDKDAAAATATGAARGVAEVNPAAPAPQSHQAVNQVDERELPTAHVPVPVLPDMPLDLSYPCLRNGTTEAVAADGRTPRTEGVALSTTEVQELLGVYQFLWDHRKLLGLEARMPSLADLLALLSEAPTRLPAATRRASDELHLALIRLLVGEALDELFEHTAQTSNLHRRDLPPATPPITAATWPELARRYLAAAAAARYLATSEPRSSALASLQLPGQLQNLEPADWLHYLLAGLNFPHLLSRIALLPQASSRWAADALLSADDARARAAAERALQGIKSFDLQHLDGEGQVRRGRRLLHALLTLPEDGEQLGFFAPEFGEVLRAPRGVDLHMVAARLDAGLYQSTDNWLQAVANDVRSALWLWRTALSKRKGIPGHEDARAELADEAEEKLLELLADPDTTLALSAPPASSAAASKPGGSMDAQDADVSPSKGGGKPSKSKKSRSNRNRKNQVEDGSQAAAEEDDECDPCSLDDPNRLFNPRDGCRVCWLDEDKNRILLCDSCNGEYHCYCVEPPLLEVPDGAWFCSSCTARGLGLPKADDDSEDVMGVEAERSSTPCVTTPNPTAAAAAGGASVSPSDGSARARDPCSPAFQHCHSHSHLVSDLHDRAAARRGQPRSIHAAGATTAAPANGPGANVAEAGVGEAPLSIPADVPEGPRVTVRANSRPGLQELAGLLRLVHLLGNYDYATGGPVGGDAAAFGSADAGGWTPTRRLALLSALCELAMDTNALRNSLDETVETRKKFRMEAIALRSKARQLREEQAAARKAIAEKENAPKGEDGNRGVSADAGDPVAPSEAGGKGGKGSKAGGSAKTGGKAEKCGEGGGMAASKDAADEEGGGTREAKDGGETTAAKTRSYVNRRDLSVLPEAELKRLMTLEAQVEGMAVRHETLGEDRHGNRYWWLGADHLNPQGSQGIILVELLPLGQAVADQARALQAHNERQAARQKAEQEVQARKGQLWDRTNPAVRGGDDGGRPAGEVQQEELDEWGLPKERPRPRMVAIGVDSAPGQSWAVFHTSEQLNALVDWLHPKGIREGPLRTVLLRARDRIVTSHATGALGHKQKQPAAAALQEEVVQPAAAAGEGDSGQPVPLPQLLCPAVTVATAGGRRVGGAARQGSLALPEVTNADGTGAASPAEAVVLRTELLSLHRGLPVEAFSSFWGSASRQKRWCEFVEAATSPQQLCAALTVLESMLVDEAFRPHWRLYCMPAQHPELCTTWSAAWYRLGALQGAIRKQILTQRELHHQAASETAMAGGIVGKAGKGNVGVKDKAVATAKQQQQVVTVVHQERYPSRRGGSATLALPDISNVRSREAAALLGKAHKDAAAGKSQKDAVGGGRRGQKDAVGGGRRGQKRHRSVTEDDDEETNVENGTADRKRGKRTTTTAAKDGHSRRRGAVNSMKDHSEEAEVDTDNGDDDALDEEKESGSSSDAEASRLEADEEEEEEEEEEDASDEDDRSGRKKRMRALPSRASARLQKSVEGGPMTRRSSRLTKDKPEEDDELSSSSGEEDLRPAKCTRGAAAATKTAPPAAAVGRVKTRSRAVVESSDGDKSDSDQEEPKPPARVQGRNRGGITAATVSKQANESRPAVGSRAAAILANRKRALADWSEESESEDESKRSADSRQTSSSGEEPPRPAAVVKRGGSASQATPTPGGRRGVDRHIQPQRAVRKPPPRRMARSEVEYDVEDFDDLNT